MRTAAARVVHSAGPAAAVCAALVLSATPAGPAGAQEPAAMPTTAAIRPSLHPDRLGARAALTFTVRFGGGELGVPSPVRRAVVHFPPGLTMHIPSLRSCTSARLRARGASGCPARSLIGVGHALADIHAGAGIESEEAKVWAFLASAERLPGRSRSSARATRRLMSGWCSPAR
jgi:hypothetical protein